MIENVLLRGKKNATPAAVLCDRFGVSARELRHIIAREREAGAVILSDAAKGGYYLPADKAELLEFIKVNNARAFSTLRTVRSAKQALKEIETREGGTP